MCTLSWRAHRRGYELFFSRDERRTRAVAEAPSEIRVGGVRVLAPRDPEGGGAWLAVNERGLALALLNRYEDARPGPFASRGRIVLAHAAARDAREIERALHAESLARYAPFDLAVFTPQMAVVRFRWDGRALAVEPDPRAPLASSSVAAREARDWRTRRHAHLDGLAFHRDHVAPRPELATCMHRPDAVTVSLSHVRVGPERVAFAYAPGAPCRTALGPALELARA